MTERPVGSAVLEPTPYFDDFSELFDRFTRTWDGISSDFDDWVAAALPARCRAAVDLGCGAGRHSVLLAEHADRVLAVDVSDQMLKVARAERARPGIDYQRRGVMEVTREDGPFDVVLSVHTMHHVGDPAVVLPHVRSLVAPGGTLIACDLVDPGDWRKRDFHLARAFGDARLIYTLTGDGDAAADIVRLLLHPRWLELISNDIPLSRAEFHRAYSAVFPGAAFVDDLNPIMCGLVWRAPV